MFFVLHSWSSFRRKRWEITANSFLFKAFSIFGMGLDSIGQYAKKKKVQLIVYLILHTQFKFFGRFSLTFMGVENGICVMINLSILHVLGLWILISLWIVGSIWFAMHVMGKNSRSVLPNAFWLLLVTRLTF